MTGLCCTLLLRGGHRIVVRGDRDEVEAMLRRPEGPFAELAQEDGVPVRVLTDAVVAIKAGWHG